MKNKLVDFFKSFSKLDWVAAFFASGAVWMLIGLIVVLLTPAPEAGAIILLIGLGLAMISIPMIFVCSLRRALKRDAARKAEPEAQTEPIPAAPQPPVAPPTPVAPPIPVAPPTPVAPQAEPTIAIPKVQAPAAPAPQATAAPKPSARYLFLLDELNVKHRTSLNESELNGISGMTVIMAQGADGFTVQKLRALYGKLDTERYTIPADFFKTNTKNDFKIWLFKCGIFRVDVDLLWEEPAFRAVTGV